MIDFKEPSRREQIEFEPILAAFIAQCYRDIAYGGIRAAVSKVDDAAQPLPRKDHIFLAHVGMNGKAGQRDVSRAAKFLQNADAFLHMRPKEALRLAAVVGGFELQKPPAVKERRGVGGDRG